MSQFPFFILENDIKKDRNNGKPNATFSSTEPNPEKVLTNMILAVK